MLEHIYHKPLLDADELLNTLMEYADMIKPEDFIDQSIIDRWYGEAHGGFHENVCGRDCQCIGGNLMKTRG